MKNWTGRTPFLPAPIICESPAPSRLADLQVQLDWDEIE
jgi:hypothetical protein